MARSYRFDVGDRVRIHATPTSSVGVKVRDGEIVTVKARCGFTWAYEVEEYPGLLFMDNCFEPAD